MQASYDPEADAMYIPLGDAAVADTEVIDDRTIVDVDDDGNVIGIELLGVSQRASDPERFDVDILTAEKAAL